MKGPERENGGSGSLLVIDGQSSKKMATKTTATTAKMTPEDGDVMSATVEQSSPSLLPCKGNG